MLLGYLFYREKVQESCRPLRKPSLLSQSHKNQKWLVVDVFSTFCFIIFARGVLSQTPIQFSSNTFTFNAQSAYRISSTSIPSLPNVHQVCYLDAGYDSEEYGFESNIACSVIDSSDANNLMRVQDETHLEVYTTKHDTPHISSSTTTNDGFLCYINEGSFAWPNGNGLGPDWRPSAGVAMCRATASTATTLDVGTGQGSGDTY